MWIDLFFCRLSFKIHIVTCVSNSFFSKLTVLVFELDYSCTLPSYSLQEDEALASHFLRNFLTYLLKSVYTINLVPLFLEERCHWLRERNVFVTVFIAPQENVMYNGIIKWHNFFVLQELSGWEIQYPCKSFI